MKVSNLIEGIKSNDLLLPEFQREYVWSKEQAKQLIISMYKEYPTGCILLWETTSPPEVKNNKAIKAGRLYRMILDGQQRLTTLYMFITNEIPPYYTEKDIENMPLDLYVNLLTGEFQYYQKLTMNNAPVWQRVVDCLKDNEINPFKIIAKYNEMGLSVGNEMDFCSSIYTVLAQLRKIKDMDYKELIVPNTASIDDAIDVFDRVNSLGTKLTDAELALTHITGKWPTARREMKKALDAYKNIGMELSLDFLTRCVVIALSSSALFDNLDYSKYEQANYIEAWKQVKKACDYLLPVLKNSVKIHDTNDLSTTNILVPIVAYLLANDIQFNEQAKNGFLYWMFLAMIWGRYSGQTNQRLDKDVQICLKESKPIKDLLNEIVEMRGRLEVKVSDLEGKTAGHPLYKMFYILTKNLNAVDFANGSYIGDTIGDYYSIQSHHLFPKEFLRKNGYDSNNTIHKKLINEIANRAFITRDTNYSLGETGPETYLVEVSEKYPMVFHDHFIPKNKNFWKPENYHEFLAERRKLIADAINEFLNTLYNKYKSTNGNNVESHKDRISNGEDTYTEFKSTLLYSLTTNKAEKYIEFACAKTICAFLNSEGGRLFIGVEDDGNILGLDNDFSLLSKANKHDDFRLRFDNIIRNYIGLENSVYISTNFIKIDEKEVFEISVSASNSPCYIKSLDKNKEEFYIRQSASSQPLSMSQTAEYISKRFND